MGGAWVLWGWVSGGVGVRVGGGCEWFVLRQEFATEASESGESACGPSDPDDGAQPKPFRFMAPPDSDDDMPGRDRSKAGSSSLGGKKAAAKGAKAAAKGGAKAKGKALVKAAHPAAKKSRSAAGPSGSLVSATADAGDDAGLCGLGKKDGKGRAPKDLEPYSVNLLQEYCTATEKSVFFDPALNQAQLRSVQRYLASMQKKGITIEYFPCQRLSVIECGIRLTRLHLQHKGAKLGAAVVHCFEELATLATHLEGYSLPTAVNHIYLDNLVEHYFSDPASATALNNGFVGLTSSDQRHWLKLAIAAGLRSEDAPTASVSAGLRLGINALSADVLDPRACKYCPHTSTGQLRIRAEHHSTSGRSLEGSYESEIRTLR